MALATPLPQDRTTSAPRQRPSPDQRRAELRLAPEAAPRRATLAAPRGVWAAVVGSRALLLLVGYLTVARVPQAASTARTLTYNREQLLPGTLGQVFNAWANWDGQWYVKIARVGYPTRDYAAFFPFYPGLVRSLGPLTAHRYIIAGVVLSLAFYVAAMYVLYRLIAIDYGSRVATWTVTFTSLFPTSFFFQAVYTESAFLFLVVTCLFFARREHWLFAGLAGFLAALTRNTGVLLLLPMTLFYLGARGWRPRRIDRQLVWFALVPAGLAVWMVYLRVRLGNALAFSQAQLHWHRSFTAPWVTLVAGWHKGISGITTLLLHHGQASPLATTGGSLLVSSHIARNALPNALNIVVLVGAVVALALSARRLKLPYLVYGFAALAAPLFYPTPLQPLYSMPRFALVVFPVFLALALLTERLVVTRIALLAVSTVALVLLTSVFVRFIFGA
jgi:hypothetical protein